MIAPIPQPGDNDVTPESACPTCGERDADQLVWLDDETVRCARCGTEYQPLENHDAESG